MVGVGGEIREFDAANVSAGLSRQVSGESAAPWDFADNLPYVNYTPPQPELVRAFTGIRTFPWITPADVSHGCLTLA